jgi:hypothetical protein
VVPSADTDADNAEVLQQQLAYFPRATHALVSAYETFLLQQPPPSFLEPVRVTVTLEPSVPPAFSASASASAAAAAGGGGGGSASSLQLRFTMRAYDDFGRLLDRIVAESRAPEQQQHNKAWALRCINLESQQPFAASAFAVARGNVAEFLLSVSDGSGASNAQPQQQPPVSLEVSPALRIRSFASLSIHGGSHVSLRIVGGSSTLQFLVPPVAAKPRCFMHTYRANDEQQRVDYFKCAPCGLNWLCKNCASTCHSGVGHTVAPFIMGHKPTYAACYCNKKRQCTLKE